MSRITGKTKIIGVWGHPVGHSRSPAMHNAALKSLGLDWVYVPFDVNPDNAAGAVAGLRALGLAGVNVTVPLKECVLPLLDEVDEAARQIGSVNTIHNIGGRLFGYSTDGEGFLRSLEAAGQPTQGRQVLILGAGGSARAVAFALALHHCHCQILLGGGVAMALSFPQAYVSGSVHQLAPSDLEARYNHLSDEVRTLEDAESQAHIQVADDKTIAPLLATIQLQSAAGQTASAEDLIATLEQRVTGWQHELAARATPAPPVIALQPPTNALYVPILIYHYPPPNLEQQLQYLIGHGYTDVDLDQVAAAMSGGAALPAKPVVLTFDDGFENQLSAFSLLKKYNMKATFYIINGGPASNWCIGAGRQFGLPSQPASGCGDAYLSWDQVRMLDASGLVTIGGHTLDHPNLPTLSEADQRHEIIDSKTAIEAEIGHPIRHFAYPYGDFNGTTIQIVRDAGYVTAVTTIGGTYQDPGSQYTLHRVRDATVLP